MKDAAQNSVNSWHFVKKITIWSMNMQLITYRNQRIGKKSDKTREETWTIKTTKIKNSTMSQNYFESTSHVIQ